MNPKRILNKKSASKDELRKALALALNVPCPEWANKPPTVSARCKLIFTNLYERKCGVEYSWQAKDAACLNSILKKLYGIAKDTNDETIVNAFNYMMKHLPKWYLDHGFALCTINGKFNEIVNEIRTSKGGKTTVSDDYKYRVLSDLQS